MLVTQPLIGGENYSAWARAVRKALLTKNKLGFIDGTLTLLSPLISTPSSVQAWIRCDNMVGTWLTIQFLQSFKQALYMKILL